MYFGFQKVLSLTCLLFNFEFVLSTPLPRAHHEIHVDLIDSIFQIPIQTLNAVGNLLKNVHNAKKNFLSINVHVGPTDQFDHKPSTTPNYHPASKPITSKPTSGYPDFIQPSSYRPEIGSTIRPVSGTTELSFPETTNDASYSSLIPEGSFTSSLSTTNSYSTQSFAQTTSRPYKSVTNSNTNVQPLSLDLGPTAFNQNEINQNAINKQNAIKEKNFKEYVQRKLAEKNLNENRISHF